MITPELIARVRGQFRLEWHGTHGIRHWARVYDNGMRLAARTGARVRVVQLFALFHDSCRQSEGRDDDHGVRGAALANALRAEIVQFDEEEWHLLELACRCHTAIIHHADATVATCFDADRLDLGRVGRIPDPSLLATEAARDAGMIAWALGRSRSDHLADNILGRAV